MYENFSHEDVEFKRNYSFVAAHVIFSLFEGLLRDPVELNLNYVKLGYE